MRTEYFKRNFYFLVILGFTLSLTTPILDALGYHWTGFLPRLYASFGSLVFFGFIHGYPLLAASIAALLIMVSTIVSRMVFDHGAILFQYLYNHLVASPQLWSTLIISGITLIIYLLVFRAKASQWFLFAGGAAVFVPLWYRYVDSAFPAAVFYTFFWLIMIGFNNGRYLWEKLDYGKGEGNKLERMERLRQGWLAYTSVVLLPAVFLAFLLPKNFAPVPLEPVQRQIGRAFPILYELRSSSQHGGWGDGGTFSPFSSGFQGTSVLGGPFRQDPTVLMEVRGEGGIYLKGAVKDRYTGRSWSSTTSIRELSGFPSPPGILENYLEAVEIRVLHLRLRTDTVFSLQYPLEIRGLRSQLMIDGNNALSASGGVPRGRDYLIRGKRLVYRGEFSSMETSASTAEMQPYLQLPELTPRVWELALTITGESRGHYEKLKALEGYLRRNFTYNTETPKLPEDIDFVDHFIFDLGEGYCTYFATALAVMGRAVGVPTRYVEGFKVPDEPYQDDTYQVAGLNSHAWVEGYIPGIGWMYFEPTPPYGTHDSLPMWREPVEADPTPSNNETAHGGGSLSDYYFDDEDELYDFYNGFDGTALEMPEDGFGFGAVIRFVARMMGMAAFSLALFFGFLVLYRLLRLRRGLRRLKGLSSPLKAVIYYNLALSLLDKLGEGKFPGETPREYSQRIIRRVHSWDLNFREISEGINLLLYGNGEGVPTSLAVNAESFFRHIFQRYLTRVGKWEAFVEVLLQGKYFSRIEAWNKKEIYQ